MDSSCHAVYHGGRGVILENTETVIMGFQTIKALYDKDDRKQVAHIIIGAAEKENMTVEEMLKIAECASEYFYKKGFQNYYVLHFGSDFNPGYLHIHMAVNTVNGYNGKRLYENYSSSYDLKGSLALQFNEYPWSVIRDNGRVWEE